MALSGAVDYRLVHAGQRLVVSVHGRVDAYPAGPSGNPYRGGQSSQHDVESWMGTGHYQ
jgi:hypothetical protein